MTTNKTDLSRLADELAKWRREADMTQNELADAVGVHVTYIQKLESTTKTKRKPAMDMLIHILATIDERRQSRGLEPIDFNYAFKLANYPEIAPPIGWVKVLQSLNTIPTNELGDKARAEEIAREIIDQYKRGSIDEPPQQRAQSHQESSERDRDQAPKEASKDARQKPPPHGGK